MNLHLVNIPHNVGPNQNYIMVPLVSTLSLTDRANKSREHCSVKKLGRSRKDVHKCGCVWGRHLSKGLP
jgi:hypothetical protein